MDNRPQDNCYEQLCTDMREYALTLHERNRKTLRAGTIALVVIPVILGLVRWLTHSDKVVFLLLWVFCIVILCAFLITVEYLDYSVQKRLEELTEQETDFDTLLNVEGPKGQIASHVRERVEEITKSRVAELKRAGAISEEEAAQVRQEGGEG